MTAHTTPPPDAAAHVEAIRAALDDGYDPLDDWEYLSAKNRDAICDHVAALDAARVAAEQRAARLREAYLDAEQDSVTYALPAHNDEHDDHVTQDAWVTALREAHLDPGDIDPPGDPEALS